MEQEQHNHSESKKKKADINFFVKKCGILHIFIVHLKKSCAIYNFNLKYVSKGFWFKTMIYKKLIFSDVFFLYLVIYGIFLANRFTAFI